MVEQTPKYQPDPRLLEARVALARHLGLPPDDVTISIGHSDKNDRFLRANPQNADAPTEDVVITIHKQGYDIEPARLKEELRAQLAQLAPLNEVAQMVPEVEVAKSLVNELKATTAGTSFDQKLLEWPGFDPELHKHGVMINDYAVENVRSNAYGVEFEFRFPSENRGDQAATMQNFAEVQRGRVEAIKEVLLERTLKYAAKNIEKRGLNAEELSHIKTQAEAEGRTPEQIEELNKLALQEKIVAAQTQIREQFAQLSIDIVTHPNRISVEIRSPEQAAAHKHALEANLSPWQDPDNADQLRSTNPLTSLTVALTVEPTPATDDKPEKSPQLHKALARSFLFDKDKNPVPDFVKIAGRKDIQVAIAKEMMKILPEHPEKETEFRQMLDSPLFKQHELWHGSGLGQADVSKPYPVFDKVAGENDTVSISIPARNDADPDKNQIKKLIEGLAALNAVQQEVAGPQPAPQPQPMSQQAEIPPQVQQEAAQPQPDLQQDPMNVYKNLASEIIQQYKPKGWSDRARDGQEAAQVPATPGR